MKFRAKCKFFYKNNFCQVLLLKPLEIRLDLPVFYLIRCVEDHFCLHSLIETFEGLGEFSEVMQILDGRRLLFA